MIRHPAKYTDSFIPIFAGALIQHGCESVLDPFAGTGKIGLVKEYGFSGVVYANEIEKEWIEQATMCDATTCMDAEKLYEVYPPETFDAIVTSPTYGNRMADHHNAKDGSRRNTYTHCLGHALDSENTGKMQWGDEYRRKHEAIYATICKLVKKGGLFVLNVSNHIRKGVEVDVCKWHKTQVEDNGYVLESDIAIATNRLRFGANSDRRCQCEHVYIFRREC